MITGILVSCEKAPEILQRPGILGSCAPRAYRCKDGVWRGPRLRDGSAPVQWDGSDPALGLAWQGEVLPYGGVAIGNDLAIKQARQLIEAQKKNPALFNYFNYTWRETLLSVVWHVGETVIYLNEDNREIDWSVA